MVSEDQGIQVTPVSRIRENKTVGNAPPTLGFWELDGNLLSGASPHFSISMKRIF